MRNVTPQPSVLRRPSADSNGNVDDDDDENASNSQRPALRHPTENSDSLSDLFSAEDTHSKSWVGRLGRWRRPFGLILLFVTVLLWTASNFLASTIFADDSYSKPYFVTYLNTACFILPLIPVLIKEAYCRPEEFRSFLRDFLASFRARKTDSVSQPNPFTGPQYYADNPNTPEAQALLIDDSQQLYDSAKSRSLRSGILTSGRLSLGETARVSLEFCLLWFAANYFVGACLEYTTVASSTILTSTSSVFTLLFGAFFGVERYTVRKLLGVLASLAGIAMISSLDLNGSNNDEEHRGDFPEKTMHEIAIGDALAFLSAVLYGMYAVFFKYRVGDESRINMPLFFGFVGVSNVLLLWPGLLILHFTGVERFELPSSSFIWLIVIFNSIASLLSDIAWAFAVLLTSPIVVTVGLSMSIPLSLVGEMVLNNQTVSVLYLVGACIVLLSFVFVNHEEKVDGSEQLPARNDG